METTPMTFIIDIPSREWFYHPLRMEWKVIPDTHPLYGAANTLILFLEQEYNINMIDRIPSDYGMIKVNFKSEQDYTLWKLHQ